MMIYRMQASFGPLAGEELCLAPGLNLITAPNESGKSSWCAFLLAMLYGIKTRERASRGQTPEKTRWKPWSGAPLEGLLECDYGGRRIILRRSSPDGQPFSFFSAEEAETGHPIRGMTGGNAGQLICGVSREVFERSLLFRQDMLSVEQSSELEERIVSLLSSGEEEVSWTQADARLQEWKRRRRYYKNGEIPALEEEASILTKRLGMVEELTLEQDERAMQLRTLERDLEKLLTTENMENRRYREELEERWIAAGRDVDTARLRVEDIEAAQRPRPTEELPAEDNQKRVEEKRRLRSLRSIVAAGVLLLLALLPLVPGISRQLEPPLPYLICAAFVVAAVGIGALNWHWNSQDKRILRRLQLERKRDLEFWEEQQRALEIAREREQRAQTNYAALNRALKEDRNRSEELTKAERRVAERRTAFARLSGRLQEMGDATQLRQQLATLSERIVVLQREFEAIVLATKALESADLELRERFSPALNDCSSSYFAHLTNGAYEGLQFGRDFTAKAKEAGSSTLRVGRSLSRGALDQVYLALRLGICELVLPEEKALPLVFDDALSSFDDMRMMRALSLLQGLAARRQIIFFSCQGREERLFHQAELVSCQRLVPRRTGKV